MEQNKNMKYGQAIGRIEEIVNQIEQGKLDIDSVTESIKEAQQLIQLCKDKLLRTEEEVNKIIGEKQ
ncbi:MAG: exodeoxyribonuclease VII small subunit [Bacteroidaceae bacterium]|nr:exodeoxyribonuclease VII small subunit [Bacteroidaceae bacterium]